MILNLFIFSSPDSGTPSSCVPWPLDLKLTHLDWNPEATLIHFQAQYLTICELDYNILQDEIRNTPKTSIAVDIGDFCLVEDVASATWYRGRVQNRKDDQFDVFLVDHGNVLSVDVAHLSSCSKDLFILPPKIVSGFLVNVLLLQSSSQSVLEDYFFSLIGKTVTGYGRALLPHEVLLFEAPDVNNDLVRQGFGRHVDTNTFLFLVEMLTEVPVRQNLGPVPDLIIEKPEKQEISFKPPARRRYKDFLSFCRLRLRCGARVKVRVSAAVSAKLFYCQMVSKTTELLEMSTKLAAVFRNSVKDYGQATANVGILCSVKHKDEKWYRGFVPFLPINSQVRVLFIDYGFYESVKVEDIQRLPPDLFSTPVMAFPCSLSCLQDQDEAVKDQQLSFLKAGLLGAVLDLEICSFDKEHDLCNIKLFGAEDNPLNEPESVQESTKCEVSAVLDLKKLSRQDGSLYFDTVIEEALGKTVEEEKVQVGAVFVGYVTHVQNPSQFWIRTQKRSDEFMEMTENMADHFSRVKLDEEVIQSPQPGSLCCAVHEEDMHFYRAIVTDILNHGAEVFFLDYGNTEKVPYMLIKKIPEALARKPPFAICCTLNILPTDDLWSSSVSGSFRQTVSNKAVLVRVVHIGKNKCIVDLYEMGCDNKQSITDYLLASHQTQCWNRSSKQLLEDTNVQRMGAGSNMNLIPERWAPYQGKSEEVHEKVRKTAVASKNYKSLSVQPGLEFAVCCTFISSPSDFWCLPLDKIPALDQLMDKIQQYYSTNTVPLQTLPCCVVKTTVNGRWCRAFITERTEGHAKVVLVDYGYTLQVQEQDLQEILPEFVTLEAPAFRCCSFNLVEAAEDSDSWHWSPEACSSVKRFVMDSCRELSCKIISQVNVKDRGLYNVVDLYSTQTQQSLKSWLMEQGLAREATIWTKNLSVISPESFMYSSYDLGPGNDEEVFITHVSSQWEVFCHLKKNTEIINNLENTILEESEKMMKASAGAVVRKPCLAKYLDGRWYRGFPHAVQSPLHLSVFFVDYGNENICEKAQVLFIPTDSVDLLYTPMQAMRFHLVSVCKQESYADVKEWLSDAVLNKETKAFIHRSNEDGSFDVELFDGDVNVNKKVKQLIFRHRAQTEEVVGFSRKTKPSSGNTWFRFNQRNPRKGRAPKSLSLKPDRTPQSRHPSQRMSKERHNAHVKSLAKDTKIKQEAVDGTKPSSVETSHVAQRRRDLDKSSKSIPQKDTNAAQLSCLPEKKVNTGLRADCFMSHFQSLTSFYLYLSDDGPSILKMAEELNSPALRNSLETATSVTVSDLALAEYEEDGALYRCVVKDHQGSSSFVVEFVDYGSTAAVEKKKIYVLPKEYLTQPRFSIHCSLLDPSTFQDGAAFTDTVAEKPLVVDFVRQRGSVWEVLVDEAEVPSNVERSSGEDPEKEVVAEGSPLIIQEVTSCEPDRLIETVVPVHRDSFSVRLSGTGLETTVHSLTDHHGNWEPVDEAVTPGLRRLFPVRTNANQNFKTTGEGPHLDCPPPQKLLFASVDMDREYFGVAAAVKTPSEFYVILEDLILSMNQVSNLLDDLPEELSPLPESHIVPGTCCLLKTGSQMRSCRAEIVQTSTRVDLNLVDYGHCDSVPHRDHVRLKRLPEELLKLPKVTYPCRLGGVRPTGKRDQWTDEAAVYFQKQLEQKNLQITFRELLEESFWKVDVVADGVHVANDLVEGGHACFEDVMLGLR